MRKLNEKVVKNISQVSRLRKQVDGIFICQKRECQRKGQIKEKYIKLSYLIAQLSVQHPK